MTRSDAPPHIRPHARRWFGALTAMPASADVALAGDTYIDLRKVLLWRARASEFRKRSMARSKP